MSESESYSFRPQQSGESDGGGGASESRLTFRNTARATCSSEMGLDLLKVFLKQTEEKGQLFCQKTPAVNRRLSPAAFTEYFRAIVVSKHTVLISASARGKVAIIEAMVDDLSSLGRFTEEQKSGMQTVLAQLISDQTAEDSLLKYW